MDIQSRLVGAYTTCSRRKMAGYIRPSEHSPRRKLHPQLSRCSIDIALIMIGSCNFKAEEDTVHHHRVLRCKRDIARYWKPLVYHWQYWKLHHMGQVSTGSYECYGVIGGYIHSLQFLPLKQRQRGPFQGNQWLETNPRTSWVEAICGHWAFWGKNIEDFKLIQSGFQEDLKLQLPYYQDWQRTNWTSIPCLTQGMRKTALSGDLEQAEMVLLRPESPS